MSITSRISAVTQKITRKLRGETVLLKDNAGGTVVTIEDAVVSIQPATVPGAGEDMPDKFGVLRLAATHRPDALASFTATVRGIDYQIVHVGEISADLFRVDIVTRKDQNSHTNRFDLHGRQIPWSST